MRILILGAGKMGLFFADCLSDQHEVALYDVDPDRLRFTYRSARLASLEEVATFAPEMLVNSASLQHTIQAFQQALPYLPEGCILTDIASVKRGLGEFYSTCAHPWFSSHPMFGPTFGNLKDLRGQNAILIEGNSYLGLKIFAEVYHALGLNVRLLSMQEHDQEMACALSLPFLCTLAFAEGIHAHPLPGTTWRRHLAVAHGLLSEDDNLLEEILFTPDTVRMCTQLVGTTSELERIVKSRDGEALRAWLGRNRSKLAQLPSMD